MRAKDLVFGSLLGALMACAIFRIAWAVIAILSLVVGFIAGVWFRYHQPPAAADIALELVTWEHCQWFVDADAHRQAKHLEKGHNRALFDSDQWPSTAHNRLHAPDGWTREWNKMPHD